MSTKSVTRLLVTFVAVLAGVLGTAGAASAVPATGTWSGNKCVEGRQNTGSYGNEACYFLTATSASSAVLSAGVFDGQRDGYDGRVFLAVQQLDSSGRVLQTITQSVTVTSGSGYTRTGAGFALNRVSGAYYVKTTVTAHTVRPSDGAILDSASSAVTKRW